MAIPTNRSLIPAFLLVLFCVPAAAFAAVELTPLLGFLAGGDIEAPDDPDYDFDKDSNWGVSLGIPLVAADQLEFLYAEYETALRTDGPDGLRAAVVDFTYAHIGGLWENGGSPGSLFAAASVGILDIDPQGGVYSSDTFPSLGLGGGGKYFFTDHIGIRGEGRVFANWIDGSRDVFCNQETGCLGRVSGSFLWQFQAAVGLAIRFGN